jgi:hypothetical protein
MRASLRNVMAMGASLRVEEPLGSDLGVDGDLLAPARKPTNATTIAERLMRSRVCSGRADDVSSLML